MSFQSVEFAVNAAQRLNGELNAFLQIDRGPAEGNRLHRILGAHRPVRPKPGGDPHRPTVPRVYPHPWRSHVSHSCTRSADGVATIPPARAVRPSVPTPAGWSIRERLCIPAGSACRSAACPWVPSLHLRLVSAGSTGPLGLRPTHRRRPCPYSAGSGFHWGVFDVSTPQIAPDFPVDHDLGAMIEVKCPLLRRDHGDLGAASGVRRPAPAVRHDHREPSLRWVAAWRFTVITAQGHRAAGARWVAAWRFTVIKERPVRRQKRGPGDRAL